VTEAYIVDAVRSPIGKRNGTLASLRADELAGQVLSALVERNGLDPAEVEDVQMGCVSQVGEQGWNIARMAALVAGWPESVPGATIDRQCGSSLQACFTAASAVSAGQLDVVVAAGVESMSRVPMGSSGGDLSPKLLERWEIVPQGVSAELIAAEWGLSREELDAYSYESHRRALAAIDEGRFEREVMPVEVSNPHAGVLFGVDETPRADTSPEALAALRPAFLPDGRVTAGNSSQICDGAAAVLVASEDACGRLGLEPRARFVSFGLAGVDPRLMLHGNPEASARALNRAGLSWDDVAVIAPVHARHRPRRAPGGRQPQRRWHLARPPARRDRRPDHGDVAERARAARSEVRRRDAVHRLRPGGRRRDRAALEPAQKSHIRHEAVTHP
jgi:acetyl-CoA acyltransferase